VNPLTAGSDLGHTSPTPLLLNARPSNPHGLQKRDWPLQSPKRQPLARVRETRDEIRALVTELVQERNWL